MKAATLTICAAFAGTAMLMATAQADQPAMPRIGVLTPWTQKVTIIRRSTIGGSRTIRPAWTATRRSNSVRNGLPDYDLGMSYNYLFQQKSRDPLTVEHVERFDVCTQAVQKCR